MSNAPDRFESFILGAGESKVTILPETRVPNANTFLFRKEDHTLGNLLRARLLTDPRVLFSGYKVPHPLVPDFELRVQTDGTVTPKQAVLKACRDTVEDLGKLGAAFEREMALAKISKGLV